MTKSEATAEITRRRALAEWAKEHPKENRARVDAIIRAAINRAKS